MSDTAEIQDSISANSQVAKGTRARTPIFSREVSLRAAPPKSTSNINSSKHYSKLAERDLCFIGCCVMRIESGGSAQSDTEPRIRV